MLLLAVDTSTQAGSLAVLEDNRVIGEISTWVEEPYSSRLFRHLNFLLAELSLNLEQFDLFAVAAGPGSFTGLRIGLTAVKGWAEVFGKPIAAVSGLEAVAAQAKSPSALLAPVMDARRGQVFGSLYQRQGEELVRLSDEVVTSPAEFLAWLEESGGGQPLTFATPTPGLLTESLRQSGFAGCRLETVSAVLAPIIGRLGYARAQRGDLVDALTLDANYVRRSDAEILWKGQP